MSGVLGIMGCLAPWGGLHLGAGDRAGLAEGRWAKGWGVGRWLAEMQCGRSRVEERQVLDGVLR